MPIPARETLKAYLETGDTPTQAQFEEIIDAMYDMAQAAQDTANAAVAAAEAIAAASIKASGFIRVGENIASWAWPANPPHAVLRETGCSISVATAYAGASPPLIGATITVDFNTASANEFYNLRIYKLGAGLNNAYSTRNIVVPELIAPATKTAAGFSFTTPNIPVSTLNGPGYQFFFFEAMA